MKNSMKGLKTMKNMFSLILIASMLVLPSCEIPTDLNDNPNEITLQDVDPNLLWSKTVISTGSPVCFPDS